MYLLYYNTQVSVTKEYVYKIINRCIVGAHIKLLKPPNFCLRCSGNNIFLIHYTFVFYIEYYSFI